MTKIVEPLFTTKVYSIGLGLSLSKERAKINAGRIAVENELGEGAPSTVYLSNQEESI